LDRLNLLKVTRQGDTLMNDQSVLIEQVLRDRCQAISSTFEHEHQTCAGEWAAHKRGPEILRSLVLGQAAPTMVERRQRSGGGRVVGRLRSSFLVSRQLRGLQRLWLAWSSHGVWISAIVILFGAELNSEIEHQTAQDSTAEVTSRSEAEEQRRR
jgi:hypothetical protein